MTRRASELHILEMVFKTEASVVELCNQGVYDFATQIFFQHLYHSRAVCKIKEYGV